MLGVMNEALRKARETAKLRKAQLEELAGIAAGTIYDLERGRVQMPGFDVGARILRVLESRGVKKSMLDRIFPVEVGK